MSYLFDVEDDKEAALKICGQLYHFQEPLMNYESKQRYK